ncbi:TPA: hypothetical protein QDC27_002649 [Burkholderia cepacia ATCC 25416]|jgi:hypothetical protein|uniref:Uncharacterized protein n=2 Tax=Burkholderia cepacia complex TaxID=87882 RepID=A0AAP4VN85_9BURK|nr:MULTISPECIES: hypothetical protein [Burkholderia]EJH9638099.1 hypothetical protein [Listeria monocytogenes]HDR9767724.1 hypothetical protein [Burkholderia cepacia ATCC 25416]ELK7725278.1 hypothetical protein [Burkholderia cenocepacia]MBA9834232.1 hypothetical protein [Burkholderia contaminans]MBD1415152.1 hypothetical protein [Burkholderia contaminans]
MGYALLPLVVLMLALSLIAGEQRAVGRVAGADARADSRAETRALQAEVFAAACVASAQAQPGLVSDALVVTWPSGLTALPGANCVTRADGAGRLVFAGVPTLPGAAGVLMERLNNPAFWYAVPASGTAKALIGGQTINVPTTFVAGTLLYQGRVTP